jgi:hypothetical protein
MFSFQYQRTDRGNLELDTREIRLTARQRALLLLIEVAEQSLLSQQQVHRLATPDNLQALMSHDLIVPKDTVDDLPELDSAQDELAAIPVLVDVIEPTEKPAPAAHIQPDQIALWEWEQQILQENEQRNQPENQIAPEVLTFEQIKDLMISSLKAYCGLLAFSLMRDIQQASRMAQLKMCQMQWVALLSESKADAKELGKWVNQINHSYIDINKN